MLDNSQFSSGPERWSEISDFPDYMVSDRGRVKNLKKDTLLTPSSKGSGLWMVGLMRDCRQHKRSLTKLVADAFVPPHPNEAFDTPINLNGDRGDNHFLNIMWRPLWFARKYFQQFNDEHMTYHGVLEDVETHLTYDGSMSAAIHHGLLDHEIVVSMQHNTYVWPTGQIFRKAA